MTDGRWRISVTAPDWGQDHLSLDAIVAYVDDELDHGPHLRATQHLAQCRECAAQVVAQGQARSALRTAGFPSLPSSLLSSLRSIPQDTDLPGPPPGLAVTADGQLVSVLRPEPPPQDGPDASRPADHDERGERAERVEAPPLEAPPAGTARRSHHGRRPHRTLRVGTGVAVSGLALGAIALGLPSAAAPPVPVPTATGGALSAVGGGAPNVLDAQLRLPARPSRTAASIPMPTTMPALDRLDVMPGSFHGLP